MSAGVEASRAYEGGPFGAVWLRGVSVDHVGGDVSDLVDFIVARICDQLGVEHTLTKRWGDTN